MFRRKKQEIAELKRELLAEIKARYRVEKERDEMAAELEKFMEKQAVIDQFYNLLTFDGRPQRKGGNAND